MKRLLGINYSAAAFNTALLLLRVGASVMMMGHGYDKLVKFGEYKLRFMNFMGLGSTVSLGLTVFAELFCAFLVLLGLFTRLACIPLIIAMCVVVFEANNADIFGKGELGAMYLLVYSVILLVGPGRASVDGLINK
jgi:putative oxidoreductase